MGSWKPHGLNDIVIPDTGKTVCGITMDLVPARARILLSIQGFVISVPGTKIGDQVTVEIERNMRNRDRNPC